VINHAIELGYIHCLILKMAPQYKWEAGRNPV